METTIPKAQAKLHRTHHHRRTCHHKRPTRQPAPDRAWLCPSPIARPRQSRLAKPGDAPLSMDWSSLYAEIWAPAKRCWSEGSLADLALPFASIPPPSLCSIFILEAG